MVFKLGYPHPIAHALSSLRSLSGLAAIILDICSQRGGDRNTIFCRGLNDYLLLNKQSQHLSCPKGNPVSPPAIDL